jgi:imidazolonepropionase-like amidohydrolase
MPRIIFSGANLLDGDKPARANANVVVEGETIRSVGQGKLAAQPGDRVIDLDGKTLMPGLISSHFHASFNNITIQPEQLGVEKP